MSSFPLFLFSRACFPSCRIQLHFSWNRSLPFSRRLQKEKGPRGPSPIQAHRVVELVEKLKGCIRSPELSSITCVPDNLLIAWSVPTHPNPLQSRFRSILPSSNSLCVGKLCPRRAQSYENCARSALTPNPCPAAGPLPGLWSAVPGPGSWFQAARCSTWPTRPCSPPRSSLLPCD